MSDQLEIGPYRLAMGTRELLGAGPPLRLGDRAFNILRLLAERREEVVSKKDLLAGAWPDSIVDEAALRFQIATLRKALGNKGQVQIVNASGRGYMLSIGRAPEQPPGTAAPNNLPPSDVELIGRDNEIAEVADRIETARLTSLVGTGGVGKTSIALAVASKLTGKFPRVTWIDFSSLDDPSKVVVTAATALQVPLGSGDPIESLVALLQHESALLVFDNCEHVSADAARLADALLKGTEAVRLLVTSREPLRLNREHVHRVQPLPLPPASAGGGAAAILEYSAIELFAKLAHARSGYALTDADARAVSTICHHLDGIPLAIQLAAAWVEAFPPQLLAAELRAHLLRAEGGPWDASPRHRTLEATLEWSFGRLQAALRDGFARLSVFRGEFDLDAAVSVLGIERGAALALLAELVAKSLVEVRRSHGTVAYRLLFVPRAYGEEKLRLSSYEREAREAHALVVLSWLSRHDASLRDSSELKAWLLKYGPMTDDIRAAMDWALSAEGDRDLACRLADEGAVAWFRLSIPYEGAQYLKKTLVQLEVATPRSTGVELRIKTICAALMIFSAHWIEANPPPYEEAVKCGADRETLKRLAWCHWVVAFRVRRHSESLTYAKHFQVLADPNEPSEVLAAERMLGTSTFCAGRIKEGIAALERVVETSSIGVTYSNITRLQYEQTSGALVQLAHAYWMAGRIDESWAAGAKAVATAEATGHGLMIAFAILWGVAHIAAMSGDPDAAEEALDRLAPYLAGRNVDGTAATAIRAIVFGLRGAPEKGAALVRELLDSGGLAAMGYSALIGMACEVLGRGGNPELALSAFEEAMSRCIPEAEDCALPDVKRSKAVLMVMARGEAGRAQAVALFDEALAQARAQGALGWEAKIIKSRSAVFEHCDA